MIDYTEDDNSRKSQSCSPSTCSFSENASKEKSDFEIVVEERPLHVDQIQISPKDLHEYIKPSLLVEYDQPSDLKGNGCSNLFSEYCNLLNSGSVGGNFKRDFGVPVYDEYEEAIPKETVIEPRYANGDNQAAMQSQKVEIGKDSKCSEVIAYPCVIPLLN